MRLIYVVRTFQFVGGIERTLADKANWLSAHGHEVKFVTYKQSGETPYFPLDKHVTLSDLDCSIYSLYKFPLYARLFRFNKLRRSFRERIKRVIKSFAPDVIVAVIPGAEDFMWDIMKVASGKKVIVESHVAFNYLLYGKSYTDHFLYLFYSPFNAIRKADLLVTLTNHDAESWRHHNVNNVVVLPNPVSFFPKSLDEVSKIDGRIISVGRLAEQKRLDRLVEAFSLIANRYPKWYIDIYGDGNLREELDNLIDEKKLVGRINIFPSTQNIMMEYLRSQFFVLSSDYEGFGLVLVEAMACGIPVVSTDCPYGPSDIIDNEKTGLLAKMEVEDLAQKIEWMITHEEKRHKMGIEAHNSAAKYQKDVIIKEWERVYKMFL
jgi:glycosyltransferase involved in cell wall biosynthesis